LTSYLIRRIWQMIPTLIGVILLVFVLFTFFGGDPAEISPVRMLRRSRSR